MRIALLLIAAFVVACTNPTENEMRGQPCSFDLDCGEALLCAEFVCEPACQLEGDCDPGYACEGSICVPTCESQADCERGTCSPRDNAEEGMACHVGYLPSCAKGCAEDEVCEFGQCAPRCIRDDDCPPGLSCTTSYAGSGSVCLVSDDPEPREEPEVETPTVDSCSGANYPTVFCRTEFDIHSVCGLDGSCHLSGTEGLLVVIRDETPIEECEESVNGLRAPGADIQHIRLWDRAFEGNIIGEVEARKFHQASEENDFSNFELLETRPDGLDFCSDVDSSTFVSLGCGGSITFHFVGYRGRSFWPVEGTDVEVGEIGGRCGMSTRDRYSIGLCDTRTATWTGNGDYPDESCVFLEPESGVLPMEDLLRRFPSGE